MFCGTAPKFESTFLNGIFPAGISIDRCVHHLLRQRQCPERTGQAVVAGPYQQFATEWTADCSKLLIKIENSALENYLSTLLGRRQIRALDFEMRIDLAAGSSSSLLRVVRWILEEMDQPDSLFNSAPLAGQQCQRMLMWALLYSQPNNYSEELAARQLVQIPHYVLQTEQYIHEHYTEAMSLEQLVEQSNVSERTLLEGFKRFHDVSPMKLLKLTRLDYAPGTQGGRPGNK